MRVSAETGAAAPIQVRRLVLLVAACLLFPVTGIIARGVWVSGQCERLFSMQMYAQVGGGEC